MTSATSFNSFVNTDKTLHLQQAVGNKTLDLYCKVHPLDKNWQLEVEAKLSEGVTTKIHKIAPFILKSGEVKWVGSWDPIFAKDAVALNLSKNIPVKDLGNFSNETLLVIHAYGNGVTINSNYLKEVVDEPTEKKS